MPILFNQSNSDSLFSTICSQVINLKVEAQNAYTFYAITCYFNPEAANRLIKNIHKILGNKLQGCKILIDSNEFFKQNIDKNSFIQNISEIIDLPLESISLTPIDYNAKLFHPKAYALIEDIIPNFTTSKGFAIITSGNFTKSGLAGNIEMGQIVNDFDSLNDFVNLFSNLKNNHAISAEQEAKQREFKLAVQTLSQGEFYHMWHPSFDLIFRLNLSPEERKILRDKVNDEETKRKIGNFLLKEMKSITDDPVNIQSIFNICPKPIPPDFWGTYSIDTLLGQWVPLEISKLIEQEVEESMKIFNPILEDIGNPQKIQKYIQELRQYVKEKIDENVIDMDIDNLSAVETWQKKVKIFFKNANVLKSLICKYENINISVRNISKDVILSIYESIKGFYGISGSHQGLGKILGELVESQDNRKLKEEIEKLVKKAKERLEKNRLNELYQIKGDQNDPIQPNDNFIAFEIIKQENKNEYQRLDGTFVRLDNPDKDICKATLVYKSKNSNEEKTITVDKLRTFLKKDKDKENNENG
jgi:hypothetical protein